MRDPKKILTKDGYDKYRASLTNIREGIFYIINNADDFLIDDEIYDKLAAVELITRDLAYKEEFEDE